MRSILTVTSTTGEFVLSEKCLYHKVCHKGKLLVSFYCLLVHSYKCMIVIQQESYEKCVYFYIPDIYYSPVYDYIMNQKKY